MSIGIGNNIISGGGGVNDIFPIGVPFPTPYTSNYTPEGFVPANGQEYKAEDYKSFWDNWINSNPKKIQTLSYDDWKQEIDVNGFCMKFAIDIQRRMFKVPSIPDGFIISVNNIAKVRGNGKAIGLSNGQQNFGMYGDTNKLWASIEAYGQQVGEQRKGSTGMGTTIVVGATLDPDQSGMVAEIKSSTNNEAKWFIKLVNSTVTSSVFDYWNAIVSLQNKFQIVDEIPATPAAGVFYCIPEKAE